jgi:hypothetical protein
VALTDPIRSRSLPNQTAERVASPALSPTNVPRGWGRQAGTTGRGTGGERYAGARYHGVHFFSEALGVLQVLLERARDASQFAHTPWRRDGSYGLMTHGPRMWLGSHVIRHSVP